MVGEMSGRWEWLRDFFENRIKREEGVEGGVEGECVKRGVCSSLLSSSDGNRTVMPL